MAAPEADVPGDAPAAGGETPDPATTLGGAEGADQLASGTSAPKEGNAENEAGAENDAPYVDWRSLAEAVDSGDLAGEGFKPSGSGTAEDPYAIETPEAFAWWACLHAADEGCFAVLAADIDLTSRVLGGSGKDAANPLPWPGDAVLTGELDGAGHAVVFRTQGAGLFAEVAQTGAVRWLVVGETQAAAKARETVGKPAAGTYAKDARAGSVAGVNRGTIEGAVNLAPVRAADAADPNAAALAGGIVGQNDGRIADCANLGAVSNASGNAASAAAGIAGAGMGTIATSYNAGSVRAASNGAYLTTTLTADGPYEDLVDAASCYLAPGEGVSYEGVSLERDGAVSIADLRNAAERLNDGRESAHAVWREGAANDATVGYPAPAKPQAADQEQPAVMQERAMPTFVGSWGQYVDALYAKGARLSGLGTEGSPYLITSAEDLALFAYGVNAGRTLSSSAGAASARTAHVKVSKPDMTLDMKQPKNGSAGQYIWTPIGNEIGVTQANFYFSGTFDGNGVTLANMVSYASSSNPSMVGLFGHVFGDSVVIRNINLAASCSFISEEKLVEGQARAGGIVAYCGDKTSGMSRSSITISNCNSAASVESLLGAAGGIVGQVKDSEETLAVIEGCTNSGTVRTDGTAVGGIVGAGRVKVTDCQNAQSALVGKAGSSTNELAAGGIAGTGNASTFEGCSNAGAVTGQYAGGIVGDGSSTASLRECSNTGAVTAKQISAVSTAGGIAGKLSNADVHSVVANCFNRGEIAGGLFAGGITGCATSYNGTTVTNCYNAGKVTSDMSLHFAIAAFDTEATQTETVRITNCYYDTSLCAEGPGLEETLRPTPKTTVEMRASTFPRELNAGLSGPSASWVADAADQSQWKNDGYPVFGESPYESWGAVGKDIYEGTLAPEDGFFPSGTGTESDPYVIATPEAFAVAAYASHIVDDQNRVVATGFNGGQPVLSSYIAFDLPDKTLDLFGGKYSKRTPAYDADGAITNIEDALSWDSIGIPEAADESGWFKGHLVGGGIRIENLFMREPGSKRYCQALVGGTLGSASIADIDIASGSLVQGSTGTIYTAGIVGYMQAKGVVSGCSNGADVTGGSYDSYGKGYTAGVAAYTIGATVEKCTNSGTVTSLNTAGGIVGIMKSSSGHAIIEEPQLRYCENTGEVRTAGLYAGGVIGQGVGAMRECGNRGFVGEADGSSQTGSRAFGGVVGIADISANSELEMGNCYNTGEVRGSGATTQVGGLIGAASGADLSVTSATRAINSYAAGNVVATDGASAYRLVGKQLGASDSAKGIFIQKGFYNSDATGSSSYDDASLAGVTAKTADEMKTWDFVYLLTGAYVGDSSHTTSTYWTTDMAGKNKGFPVFGNLMPRFTSWNEAGKQIYEGALAGVSGPTGTGTQADPYLADTPADLAAYAWAANNDKAFNGGTNARTAYVKLTADIDLTGIAFGGSAATPLQWAPMGTDNSASAAYKGHIDGAGHEIDHLYFNDAGRTGAGLVGWAWGVSIDNLGIGENSSVTGKDDVAAFVGACHVAANSLTINNCYNRATVKGSGSYVKAFLGDDSGAYTGSNVGSITNCYNAGEAAFGAMSSGRIDNCYADTERFANAGSFEQHSSKPGSGVKALTTEQMKSWAASWALNSQKLDGAWATDSSTPANDGYPVFGSPLRAAADWREVGAGVDAGLITGAAAPTLTDGAYQIAKPEQLAWFAYKLGSDAANFASANAKLTANIDLAGAAYGGTAGGDFSSCLLWIPMRDFAGTFDGDAKALTNLYTTNGFFGTGFAGKLKYTGIESGLVQPEPLSTPETVSAGAFVQDIVADKGAIVAGCWNRASVKYSGPAQWLYIGGLVGVQRVGLTVEDCYNTGAITVNQTSANPTDFMVGGISGYAAKSTASIRKCYNTGKITESHVTASTNNRVDAIAGILESYKEAIANCYFLAGTSTAPISQAASKTDTELKAASLVSDLNSYQRRGPSRVWAVPASGVNNGYPVIDVHQGKEDQSAPSAPVFKAATDTTLTVTVSNGRDYYYSDSATAPTASTTPSFTISLNGTKVIDGLTQNKTYYVWTRYASSTNFNASPWSPAASKKTLRTAGTPVLSGTATAKQTLTATAAPSGATGTWQWQRSDASAADGTWTAISGATGSTYTLAAADVGKYVRVQFTGTNDYYGTTYSAASAQVAKATQATVKVSLSPTSVKFGAAAKATGSGGSGTGAFSYTSSNASVATVDASTGAITTKGTGKATITATRAADGEYLAASGTAELTVTPGDQTTLSLGFNSGGTGTTKTVKWGETAQLYTGGGSGSGAVTYASSNTAIATVDASGKITAKGTAIGNVTFTATKAAAGNYLAATSNTVTLTVGLGDATAPTGLTGTGAVGTTKGFFGGVTTLMEYAGPSAAQPAAGASATPCLGTTVQVDKAGSYWVRYAKTALQNASGWTKVEVPLGTQVLTTTLSASSISTLVADATASATSNAGSLATGAVTYYSDDTAVAEVNETTGVITPHKAGTANIYAKIAADETYAAAQSANVELTVTAGTWAGVGASAAAGTLAGFTEPAKNGDVYQIGTPEQLAWFAYKVNNDNAAFGTAKAKLTADIDLSGIAYTGTSAAEVAADATKALPWEPIGNGTQTEGTAAYVGTFDGGGFAVDMMYAVKNAEAESASWGVGLFGAIGDGAVVHDVAVGAGSKLVGTGDRACVGSVVGLCVQNASAEIRDCSNAAQVDASVSGGGIIGLEIANGGALSLSGCTNSGDVSSEGSAGGITGTAQLATKADTADSSVSVSDCTNKGAVVGGAHAGGIVGRGLSSSITDCFNAGTIRSEGKVAGGICGNYPGKVERCGNAATATVSMKGENGLGSAIKGAGGIVGLGRRSMATVVRDCYNLAEVKDEYSNSAGGIMGIGSERSSDPAAVVENCYNAGAVKGTGASGYGICGSSLSGGSAPTDGVEAKNCYYESGANPTAADADFVGVTGIDAASMKDAAFAKTLNAGRFGSASVWAADVLGANGGFPVFGQTAVGSWADVGSAVDAGTLDGFAAPAQDGSGVYQIGSAEQLAWFAYKVNHDNDAFGTAKAALTADIDLSGIAYTGKTAAEVAADATKALPWTPIGYDDTTSFAGSFDGGGHGVSNMLVDVTTDFAGMFGRFTGEKIESVRIVSGHVFGNSYGAGGIVGVSMSEAGATIANCSNAAAVSGMFAGGIVGVSSYTSAPFTVADCSNSGDIVGQVSGWTCYAGGIVGHSDDCDAYKRYERCANVGTVSATDSAGGIVGNSVNSIIADCYNRGDIEVTKTGVAVGGISAYSDKVTNCYNTGKVSVAPGSSSTAYAIVWSNNGNVTNCYALEGVADNYTDVTKLTAAEMKSWALPYKLNGGQYVGSTDGTQPASTVWTTDAADASAQTNGGYPVFGNLNADKLTVALDPAGVLAEESGAPAKKVAGDLMKDGVKHPLSGEVTLLSAPANPTDATLVAAADVDAGFSTWGTASANGKVALVVGSIPLKADTAADISLGSNLASIDLHAAAAYICGDARPVKFVVMDASMGYEVTATIKAVTSKMLDVTLPVETSFALEPDGTAHTGDKAAKASAASTVKSNNGVPIAGEVKTMAALSEGTSLASTGKQVNAVLNPAAASTQLKDNGNPITDANQVRLFAAKADGDAALTPLGSAVYFDPSKKTVPLYFAMPGTKEVAWKWGLDYTGTYIGEEGAFGYAAGYAFGLPVGDVSAAQLSGTAIDYQSL